MQKIKGKNNNATTAPQRKNSDSLPNAEKINQDFVDFLKALDANFEIEEQEEEELTIDESKLLFNEAKKSYHVDDKLDEFIDNFVTNQDNTAKQKKALKNAFFIITMIVLCLIVLMPIICLIIIAFAQINDIYAILGIIISAMIEVLATVIVLPKIVAEYLFNKEEENANIKIVELMQKYSEMMHSYEK